MSSFHYFVLLASLILTLSSGAAKSKDVIVGFGKDKPPFVFGEQKRGLEIDIARKALALLGHTLKVVHIDNKALIPSLLAGRVAAVATARDSQQRFCRVDEFIFFENMAISLKNNDLKIHSVDDLKGLSVVAWGRAYKDLGERYQYLFSPKDGVFPDGYFEHHSQASQNKMFWAGRVDVVIIDKTIFSWYRKELASLYATQQEVVYHGIFSGKTYFPALFNDQKLCKDFKQGLSIMKKSGEYRRLYDMSIK